MITYLIIGDGRTQYVTPSLQETVAFATMMKNDLDRLTMEQWNGSERLRQYVFDVNQKAWQLTHDYVHQTLKDIKHKECELRTLHERYERMYDADYGYADPIDLDPDVETDDINAAVLDEINGTEVGDIATPDTHEHDEARPSRIAKEAKDET